MVNLRNGMGRILSQLCALVAFSVPAGAQDVPPVTSNRPGIAESEALLVPRAFQVEAGFTFAEFTDEAGRHRLIDFPEATFRFGFRPRLELFANISNYNWDHASESDSLETMTGGSDLSLHAKVGLLSEETDRVTLSAAVGLSLPVGSRSFSSDGYDPSLRVLWARSLPSDFGLSGNLDVASVTVDDSRVGLTAASIGLSRPLTESTSWFVELFGTLVESSDANWQFDGGVAIVTSDDFQIDLSTGRSLRGGPAAWFASAGITLRHRR
jgi:hypothetical protein